MNTKFVHYPTLFVCMGSVFCISAAHLELADAIRRCWTLAAIIVASGYYGGRLLISHTFIKPLPLDKILKTFCCVGILEIVYASLQLTGMVHSYFCFHSFSGSFENPAVFGMLLSFCLPVSYYYALKSSAKESFFWSLVSSLFFLFIILSDSRTALLSSLFALLIVSYMELMQIKSLFRKKYFLFALIIGVIFLVGVLYVYKPESANGRFLIWSIALGMIADCPFYGWGTGGFVSQYMNRQAEYFILNPDSSFSLLAGEVSHPFNEFILVAVNYGIAVRVYDVAHQFEFYTNNGLLSPKGYTLFKAKSGKCLDEADFSIYLCRHLGIPAAEDFAPQWGNRSQGHSWSVIIKPDGKTDGNWYDIPVKDDRTYKYLRYIGGKGSYCNINELVFFDKGGKKVIGEIIGSEGEAWARKENVFDGNILTGFCAKSPDGNWVGLKLPSGTRISRLRFIPRNDGNCIEVGDDYVLYCWMESRWKELVHQKAKGNELCLTGIPSGGLYLLKDLTKGSEERIFSYENGLQVWW